MKCPHCMKEITKELSNKNRILLQDKIINFLKNREFATIKEIYNGIGFANGYKTLTRRLENMQKNDIIVIVKKFMWLDKGLTGYRNIVYLKK